MKIKSAWCFFRGLRRPLQWLSHWSLPLSHPSGARVPGSFYQESYAWLGLLKKMFHRDFCVFDKQGNILASTLAAKKWHVLDLFSKTEEAQNLLKQMESLEGAKNLGLWMDAYGQKRFLYRVS